MIDFRKKLGKKEVEKKINPLEIYDELDIKYWMNGVNISRKTKI